MPLFGKSQKSPAELVKALKEAVNSLERGDKKAEKAQEDVSKNLVSPKYSGQQTTDVVLSSCRLMRSCVFSCVCGGDDEWVLMVVRGCWFGMEVNVH